MTDFTVPAGWKFHGSANANQTTFTLPGHTVAEPHLAIFDRKVPVVQNGNTSVPWYRIRVIRGVLDADGNPITTRVTVDCTIRWPLQAASADVVEDIGILADALADANLPNDIVDEQLLPR